jgi:hypothetical protein
MSLSPNEAAEMLGEIRRTEQRSAQALCYADTSPNFILWGFIWMGGYTGTYLLPNYGFHRGINWLWFALILLGVAGSILINRRHYRGKNPARQVEGRAIGQRQGMTTFALWLFVVATVTVMQPANPAAVGAFIPLIVAAVYAIFGIWRGLRFLYAGIAVAALTLGGWLYLHEIFMLCMAVVGGGSLILVGLWLRKV